MGRPVANEVVSLRRATPFLPAHASWKVTARYTVDIDGKRTLRCVRVSCYGVNTQLALHLSEQRFAQLFVPQAKGRKP